MVDFGSTQRKVVLVSGTEQFHADRSKGFDHLASSSTRRRRGHNEAGDGTLLRPDVFDLGSTQRKVVLGSGPEQLQADRSIGLDQPATSSTGRRLGHDEAGQGARFRPVVFDLGSTQRQVVRDSGPEQFQADLSIGFDQLATSSTRRRRSHDEAVHGALLRPIVLDLGSTQRKVVFGSGPKQFQADRFIGFDQLATSSTRRRRGHNEAGHGALLRPVVFNL